MDFTIPGAHVFRLNTMAKYPMFEVITSICPIAFLLNTMYVYIYICTYSHRYSIVLYIYIYIHIYIYVHCSITVTVIPPYPVESYDIPKFNHPKYVSPSNFEELTGTGCFLLSSPKDSARKKLGCTWWFIPRIVSGAHKPGYKFDKWDKWGQCPLK